MLPAVDNGLIVGSVELRICSHFVDLVFMLFFIVLTLCILYPLVFRKQIRSFVT